MKMDDYSFMDAEQSDFGPIDDTLTLLESIPGLDDDLAERMEDIGVKYIIFTDISRDGTLGGPNLSQLEEIQNAVTCDIIASGGIKNISDISDLRNLGLYGAICGKSIYQGTLDLEEAIKAAGM